jgi:hypothetical protein
MDNHVPNIRRIYSRPRQRGTAADPGKVSTGIAVGMRPETTLFAHETMLDPLTQGAAAGACLAGVSRIDALDLDPYGLRLVLDEGLELPKGPAVQSAPHPLSRLDAVAYVGQILHRDLGRTGTKRFRNDSLARFVIRLLHAPLFFAGGLPELLFRALAAVGLQTTTQGKVLVAPMAQLPAAPHLARTGVSGDNEARIDGGYGWRIKA